MIIVLGPAPLPWRAISRPNMGEEVGEPKFLHLFAGLEVGPTFDGVSGG